ncbi:hypothetical protein JCM18694_09130 [Prolixibacter denitrificans]|uniref:Uncharacterized protein n=1 Tax=Prolixibacter denitrificans TaxID=1541063 RepID=A0ABQ0ZH53_9BACT|nr:hypothetical protein JCM18694_09130 [Prolixibacter denitrificans]
MVATTLTRKKMKKHGDTTLAIHNAGESAKKEVVTLNELIGIRTTKCLETPH